MFGLSRLLELAGKITWQPVSDSNTNWLRKPKKTIRRNALNLEELEVRVVPTLLGQQLFPTDYPWNQNISNAPVTANSAAIIAHIGSAKVHPDWGQDSASNGSNPLYGIPVNIVHGNSVAKVNVTIDNYPGESDIQPVPIPANAVIEGDYQNGPNPNGPGYNTGQRGDSHLIVWDEDNNIAYELYGAARPTDPVTLAGGSTGGVWHAAQESVWNMNTNSFRSLGYTSADAAGLSILAGLARPDEGLPTSQGGQGAILHALRFTLPSGDVNPQYIYPASHVVSTSQNAANLPFGGRLRLANTPAVNTLISNMGPEAQIIAHAMQQYGLVLADIGSSMYVTGASASVNANNAINLTWNMTDVLGLSTLNASDFQVVNLTPMVTGISATSGAAGTTITVTGQNFSGAAGHLSVLFGTTPATSVTYIDDSHLSAVVPNGTGTVDVQVQSGVTATDPNNPNDNVTKPIFGYGISTASSAYQFALSQTVSGTNSTDNFATATDASGSTDTLTIAVKDTSGKSISGLPSSAFSLSLSGGTSTGTFGAVTQTATLGTYTASFKGVTAGTASPLSITVNGVALVTQPSITVTPGAVSGITSTDSFASSTVPSGGTDALTIAVKDAAGNPITGLSSSAYVFNFAGGASGGTIGAVTETATKGTYAVNLTGGSAGSPSTLTTTISGVTLTSKPTVQVTSGGINGNSSVHFATSPTPSGAADIVTIAVKDGAGNPIVGMSNGAFGLTLAGGTSTGSFSIVTETATPGTYTSTFTGSTAGTPSTLTVIVIGNPITQTPAITVIPGAPSGANSTVHFSKSTVVSGATAVVTITVADGAGNIVSGLTNSAFAFALAGGSRGSFGTVTETATKGTYTTTFTGTTAGLASSLTTTILGTVLTTSPSMTVTPGAVSGTTSTAGFAVPTVAIGNTDMVNITVADSVGNPISGLPNSAFSFALSGGTSAGTFGPVTETVVKGTYSATFTSTQMGTLSNLKVTVSGVTLTSQPTITVITGPSGTIATDLPTFAWSAVAGATSYKIWLTDQTTKAISVFSNLTGTSWTPTQPLTLGGNYTWWAGAVQGSTVTWNNSLNFRIAPTGYGPSGTIMANMPAFTWNNVIGAASYEIWLTDNTKGQTTLVPNLSGTSWSPSQPLNLGDNYTWWIGAVQGQTTTWDTAETFRIAPTGTGPAGTIATNVPVFTWTGVTGASSYKIYLTDTSTSTTLVIPNLTGTSWKPSQELILGDNYTWWVGAVQGQTTIWDTPQNFIVAPTGSGPTGTITATSPTFVWNNVIGATSYEIWVTDQTTNQTTTVSNLSGTTWTPSKPLTVGDKYVWWVGAVGTNVALDWDVALYFTIS